MLALGLPGTVANVRGRFTWYAIVAVSLLAVAAALRFYELGQPLAHIDEVALSNNSAGTLAEVIQYTRERNSSPLLYPLILWAVQQVDLSPFSIRLLPALSGVLTVGVILLLPRFGVRREAALLAAILATLSPVAIYEARGAREYGIDALVVALLIAGVLWRRHQGRKALLCAALLVAPLLQYGLVLFGIAALGAAALLPAIPKVGRTHTERSRPERMMDWLRRRIGLAVPAAFFLAGCAISYLTTLRQQVELVGVGFGDYDYYRGLYFNDAYQIVPVLEFVVATAWNIARYHLPLVVILAALSAVAIGLVAAGAGPLCRRRGWRFPQTERGRGGGHGAVIATLFLLAMALAVGAGLTVYYPAAPTRHITYLGPAVFLCCGGALAAAIPLLAGSIRGLAGSTRGRARRLAAAGLRRERLTPALTAAAALLLAGASVSALRQDSPYQIPNAADYFAILEQSVQEDDIVYLSWPEKNVMVFYYTYYGWTWPDNYPQTSQACWHGYADCLRDVSNMAVARAGAISDVYLFIHVPRIPTVKWYDAPDTLEPLAGYRYTEGKFLLPPPALLRFPANGGLLHRVRQEWLDEYRPLLAGAPDRRGPFDVYHDDNRLTYDREPCAPADTDATFFLHIYPAGPPSVLPAPAQPYGFDNRDFNFRERGALLENRCLITVELPDYDSASIYTGQYTGAVRLWQTDIVVPAATRYAARAAGAPDARAVFNLHLDDHTLLYAKEPCAPADTAAPFFLHLTPADPAVLPAPQRPYGYDNRDFSFDPDGVRADGKCFISRPLPEYEIARIRTGQYAGADRLWQADLAARAAAAAPAEPGRASRFDIALDGNTLTYAKDPCAPADTASQFFLHLTPADRNALPESRQPHGYDNRDFNFDPDGVRADGKCSIRIALPDYEITSIRTGQHTANGEIWSTELAP